MHDQFFICTFQVTTPYCFNTIILYLIRNKQEIQSIITYSINIFPVTGHFYQCDTEILSDDMGEEREKHNSINTRSTSKITIKYVINRLLHVFCHIITHISPQKTSISPLQARGDMGFLWADTGDDMAKTM